MKSNPLIKKYAEEIKKSIEEANWEEINNVPPELLKAIQLWATIAYATVEEERSEYDELLLEGKIKELIKQ
jgi:hypothetical protein